MRGRETAFVCFAVCSFWWREERPPHLPSSSPLTEVPGGEHAIPQQLAPLLHRLTVRVMKSPRPDAQQILRESKPKASPQVCVHHGDVQIKVHLSACAGAITHFYNVYHEGFGGEKKKNYCLVKQQLLYLILCVVVNRVFLWGVVILTDV